jgi:hypothetical protein
MFFLAQISFRTFGHTVTQAEVAYRIFGNASKMESLKRSGEEMKPGLPFPRFIGGRKIKGPKQ